MSTQSSKSTGDQTHDAEGNLLPGILCLHGGGSNPTVYKIQCRRILWALGNRFRFVFAQAPHECDPGMGMLPVFASCAPFYKWTSMRYDDISKKDAEVPSHDDAQDIDWAIRQAMVQNGGVDSFVGLIGFSQGSRLTAGLLLRQKMMEREGKECWTKFKFGVMIGGPYPPIVLVEDEQDVVAERDFPLLESVPSAHGWGVEDFYKVPTKRLANIFGDEVSSQLEFVGGHHLPLKEPDSNKLCDNILAAWQAAGGGKGTAPATVL